MATDYIKLRDVKPELAEYIRYARICLRNSPVPDDDAVHDIRVLLKKARAVLRLVESQAGSEYTRKDIQSLRDAARMMSQWRDSTVLRKTLRDLKKKYPDLFARLPENERISLLLQKNERAKEPDESVSAGVAAIDELFQKTGYRIRFQNMQNLDAKLLLSELERTYSRASKAFLLCRHKPKPGNLHEFRKITKDFLYQLYFFRPLNAGTIKDLEKRLDALTRNLGKINDLSQLLKAIGYSYHDETNTPALDELAIRIREKQDRYLEKVWSAASRIFMPGRNLVNVLGYKLLMI